MKKYKDVAKEYGIGYHRVIFWSTNPSKKPCISRNWLLRETWVSGSGNRFNYWLMIWTKRMGLLTQLVWSCTKPGMSWIFWWKSMRFWRCSKRTVVWAIDALNLYRSTPIVPRTLYIDICLHRSFWAILRPPGISSTSTRLGWVWVTLDACDGQLKVRPTLCLNCRCNHT